MNVPILAATAWATNAHLIEDVARLGYLHQHDRVLDPTYGRGKWWTRWRPDHLTIHDILLDGVDFRRLPHEAGEFDAVTFDPPYVCTGGRETSTIPDFNDRFGLADTPRTPAALQAMNMTGLRECARVLRPKGLLLVKTADYIWSGKYWPGAHYTLEAAFAFGLRIVDRFDMVGRARPQPRRTRKDGRPSVQQHARRNISTLYVLSR